jgi:glycosyltransferase involved in cell wall biosynthesis
MKILLINDNHSATGGAENYFFELKSRLKQTPGIEVYSIGFGKEEQEGDDFYIFKSLSSNFAKLAGRIIPHPTLLQRLKKRIAAFQPDVIHLHNFKQYTATVLKAIKGYPVVQTVHDFSLICPTSQNIHRNLLPCPTGLRHSCMWQHRVKYNPITYSLMYLTWLYSKQQLKKMNRAYIAPSPLLTDYLLKNNFKPASYIPPFNHVAAEPTHSQANPNHFLFAGSLATHKGITLLIDEFAQAIKHNPLLTLDIAGTGPLEKTLRDQIEQLKLTTKNIRFLGWETNLAPYFQRCNALIFPSIGLESFGLVVSEAMSHGRPVIGVNRGTTAWLVEDGKTGLLFDPLKRGDLAEKILMLASNTELAMQLGSQGQQRISELIDNEAALGKIIGIYRQVL